MLARRPPFEFADVPAHWSWHHEFAQIFNASSTTAPHVEPFVNRVMAQAKRSLPADSPLVGQAEDFIKQESNHYQIHMKFNQNLYRKYPELERIANELKEDFTRFLKTKSHKFNLGYAVGFETAALFLCEYFYEAIDDLLVDADANALKLWHWHLAEEYEHRSVCLDVYNHLYGNYFYRIYMLVFAIRHLKRHNAKKIEYLLAEDRKAMTPEERAASIKREKAYRRRAANYTMPRLLGLFSPWHDPGKAPPPRGVERVLLETAAPDQIAEVTGAAGY